MTAFARRAAVAVALTSAAAAVAVAAATEPSRDPAPSAAEVLRRAAGEYWSYLESTSLEIRSLRGMPIERLPEVSLAAARREAELGERLRSALDAIDPAALEEQDLDTLGALRFAATAWVDGLPHYWVLPRLGAYASPLTSVRRAFALHPVSSRAEADRYLALLADLPRLLDELRAVAEGQAERGIRIPRPALERVLPPIEALRRPPEESPWRPSAARLAGLPPAEREAFLLEVDRRLEGAVHPAFDRLLAALRAASATAPEAIGLGRQPGGQEAYRFLVRLHTTLDQEPEAIHRLGLAELAAIEERLARLRQRFGFEGTVEEFLLHLRSDPRYRARRAEDLGERMIAAHRRIEPRLEEAFVAAARRPAGVERLDPALEGAMTFGYYDPPRPERPRGVYFFNGSRPADRNLLTMAALVYHELAPGHHFQVEAQRGNATLPAFRQEGWITAYGEGWANYASDLAGELGMYADPWDEAGYLLNDAFLTSRLVVDTGLNALGWSRAQAAEFLRRHTHLSDEEIATETLRYATDIPGQALAYKTGALRLRAMREEARAALGPRFDLRRFHEQVLAPGCLPLGVLEDRIRRWARREASGDA